MAHMIGDSACKLCGSQLGVRVHVIRLFDVLDTSFEGTDGSVFYQTISHHYKSRVRERGSLSYSICGNCVRANAKKDLRSGLGCLAVTAVLVAIPIVFLDGDDQRAALLAMLIIGVIFPLWLAIGIMIETARAAVEFWTGAGTQARGEEIAKEQLQREHGFRNVAANIEPGGQIGLTGAEAKKFLRNA
jgi:hypothetical protein